MRTKVGGTWKNPQSVHAKVGGTWKQATDGFTKVGGVWKAFAVKPLSISYASGRLSQYLSSPTAPVTKTGGIPGQATTYSVTSGTLPTGCSFSASTGTITGPANWDFPATVIGPVDRQAVANDGSLFISGTRFNWGNPVDAFADFGSASYPSSFGSSSQQNYVVKRGANGTYAWLATATAQTRSWYASDLAPTPDGGVVVAGSLEASAGGSVTFGSTVLNTAATTTGFIAKLSSSGVWQWAKSYPLSANGLSNPLASVDDSGLIYVAFTTAATVTINGSNYSTSGSTDGYVICYDANGNQSWMTKVAGTGGDSIFNLHAVGDGAMIVGYTTAGFTVGSSTVSGAGLFVAKVTTSGSWSWALKAGNGNAINFLHSFLTTSNNVVVTGYFTTSTVFGATTLTSNGTSDGFVAMATNAGAWSWAVRGGASGNGIEYHYGTRARNYKSPDSPVVVNHYCYGYNQTISFGSTSSTTRQGNAAYVAKINANGTVAWVQGFGGTSTQVTIEDVVQLPSGNTIVFGTYRSGTLVCGSTTLSDPGSSNNWWYVAILNSSGTPTSAYRLTTTNATGVARVIPYGSDSAQVIAPASSSTSLVLGGTTIPAMDVYDYQYENLSFQAIDNGTIGGQSHRGFPATLSISATAGLDSASTSVTLSEGDSRVFGGVRFADATYYYHVFKASNNFVVSDSSLDVSVLCVGGGGGTYSSGGSGVAYSTGGGGAGGVNTGSFTLSAGTYAVSVGGGGVQTNGSNTTFGALLTALGGGKAGTYGTGPSSGGSGGGGATNQAAGAGTAGQGYAGGAGNGSGGGGGGGAGAVGSSATSSSSPGSGGIGSYAFSTWAAATGTGDVNYYGGGGGAVTAVYDSQSQGSYTYIGTGGFGGGGGRYQSGRGAPNTGGGGCPQYQGLPSQGGSGLVIVRYLRSAVGG